MRNSFDWTPYRRSTVGFDRLFDFLETGGSGAENYPPFDIEKVADDHFRITVAVAGFKSDEIDITAQQNMLTVSGRKAPVTQRRRRRPTSAKRALPGRNRNSRGFMGRG